MSANRRTDPGRVAALWLALAFGCAPGEGPPADRTPPAPDFLDLAAASDLQDVMPALIAGFEREAPGVMVRPTFGSSGQLARQIKAGAPFDLFLSANMAYVRDLAAGRFVDPATVAPYAVGSLVLAVHRDAGSSVASLADVARPDLKRVAMADPEFAPYGLAARQALTRAGLWEQVGPKVVLAGSVRQAVQYVQAGNAEVGLVGRSTAQARGLRVVEIDPALYDPVVQGMGVVAESKHPADAARFARFVLGPAGRSVLKSHGFQPPPAPP